MIKRFKLINGRNEEYDLLDIAKSPTFQVEGFGYADETEFMRVGNNFLPLEELAEQRTVEFTMLVWQSVDVTYKEFVSFARHNPLTLLYENDNGIFYFPCRLGSISKIEKVGIDIKGVPVTLKITGNPYKIVSDYNAGEVGTGKSYGETGYTYDYTYSTGILNTVELRSDSYLESPCVLTLYGELTNPTWRHYLNSTLVETGAYTGTIPAGNYLVVDSKSVPYSVIEYDSAGHVVGDRYQLCDFSTERFMHIGEGHNSYVVSHDNQSPASLKAEAYIEYETV